LYQNILCSSCTDLRQICLKKSEEYVNTLKIFLSKDDVKMSARCMKYFDTMTTCQYTKTMTQNVNEPKKFSTIFGGKELVIEFGRYAHQTNGACTVQYGETVLLATAVMNKTAKSNMDYFPLMVEFQEKLYASGKIKGSRFIKREGRPSDNAVLDGRMIDRGLRPLFDQALKNDVQVIVTALSIDNDSPTEVLAIIAASAALHVSDIPWNGPIAGVCINSLNGELVLNISDAKRKESEMNMVLSCTRDKIIMIDGDAKEVKEETVLKAFEFGILEANKIIDFIESIRKEIGKEKQDVKKLIEATNVAGKITLEEKKNFFEEAKKFFAPQLDKYLFNQPKGTKRERKLIAVKLLEMFVEDLKKKETDEEIISYIKNNFESYLEEEVTKAILDKELRIDGRKLDEIRSLSSSVGLLPRTHGSGLFQRGETQVLSIVTLGPPGDAQLLDEMEEDDRKVRYMHHYNSLPFSFGEAAMLRGTGRREIGHGRLAEKALEPVLPPEIEFPYVIRVVSEVMGSNGSSSMASTCGSTLALMNAGVNIKRHVAGIAMGLASDGERYKVLTDLQDFEDGEGGMDFKITGTTEGVTAIQMDTKTSGLSIAICKEALTNSKKAIHEIIAVLKQTIEKPAVELSKYAPRIVTINIKPDRIGEIIGPGGKIIKEITEKTGCSIDIEQDGTIFVASSDASKVTEAVNWIQNIVREIEAGEKFLGKVVRLMEFGAFVELLPGKDGMVHVSEFAPWRINKPDDLVKIGDMIPVIVKEIDDKGRVNLSVKAVDSKFFGEPPVGSSTNSFDHSRRDDKPRGGFGGPRRDNFKR
jgi:polyribonucleotide nucleotidyltransferase